MRVGSVVPPTEDNLLASAVNAVHRKARSRFVEDHGATKELAPPNGKMVQALTLALSRRERGSAAAQLE